MLRYSKRVGFRVFEYYVLGLYEKKKYNNRENQQNENHHKREQTSKLNTRILETAQTTKPNNRFNIMKSNNRFNATQTNNRLKLPIL